MKQRLRTVLNEIVAELKKAEVRGKVADYIPPLARIDPAKFGIAIMLHDGTLISAGDAKEKF